MHASGIAGNKVIDTVLCDYTSKKADDDVCSHDYVAELLESYISCWEKIHAKLETSNYNVAELLRTNDEEIMKKIGIYHSSDSDKKNKKYDSFNAEVVRTAATSGNVFVKIIGDTQTKFNGRTDQADGFIRRSGRTDRLAVGQRIKVTLVENGSQAVFELAD